MAYTPKNPNGQATMANSEPVVVASDQSAIPVSGTVTANAGTGTQAVSLASLPTLAAGTNNIGDVDVLTLPALPAGNNNIGDVDVATLPVAFNTGTRSATTQRVTIATDDSVPVTGTFWQATQPVSGTVTANAGTGTQAVSMATNTPVGTVAHDAVDSGNPLKTGGMARTTNPTAVADADRANFITDSLGKQVVVGSIRDLKVAQNTTITSSTAETTILTAGAAGVKHDVYGLILTNTSATGTEVTLRDATAGTARMHFYVPATETRGFMLPESAGHNQTTAANNWTATCTTSVASIKITVLAVKNV